MKRLLIVAVLLVSLLLCACTAAEETPQIDIDSLYHDIYRPYASLTQNDFSVGAVYEFLEASGYNYEIDLDLSAFIVGSKSDPNIEVIFWAWTEDNITSISYTDNNVHANIYEINLVNSQMLSFPNKLTYHVWENEEKNNTFATFQEQEDFLAKPPGKSWEEFGREILSMSDAQNVEFKNIVFECPSWCDVKREYTEAGEYMTVFKRNSHSEMGISWFKGLQNVLSDDDQFRAWFILVTINIFNEYQEGNITGISDIVIGENIDALYRAFNCKSNETDMFCELIAFIGGGDIYVVSFVADYDYIDRYHDTATDILNSIRIKSN